MYQTKVITDESQVPPGYISMAEVRNKHGEDKAKEMSILQIEGKLPAVKLMRSTKDRSGPVWVDMRAWEKAQQSKQSKRSDQAYLDISSDYSDEELVTQIFVHVMGIDSNTKDMIALLKEMLSIQKETLSCMQRLETVWATDTKSLKN